MSHSRYLLRQLKRTIRMPHARLDYEIQNSAGALKRRRRTIFVGLSVALGFSVTAQSVSAEAEQQLDIHPPYDAIAQSSEPGVGWQNSPFLQGTPPPITSWGDVEEEDKEPKNPPPPPIDAEYTIASGDTLRRVMAKFGISKEEAGRAIKALSKTFKPRRLKPGHRLNLQIQPPVPPNTQKSLVSIDFTADAKTDIALIRDGKGGFVAQRHDRVLGRRLAFGAGNIRSSLYQAGTDEGIPPAALINLINVFSFDVDFQRDIKRNDKFALLYERLTDETGTTADIGPVIYARLKLKRRDIKLYRFKLKNGKVDYFDPKGQSVKKFLLSTPTDGARISSGFGRRRHPILGYSKLHKGVDFAAPRGTPVYAAGDGVIEVAKYFGSYGNYVRIRHGKQYKTAYAHLKGFGRGIRSGIRVRQRRVIGYIGTTGRSTGPHLHYEVIYKNRHVNPRGVRIPTGITLKGKERKRFKVERRRIDKSVAAQRKRNALEAKKDDS